ncbi:MAG: hypothetical protein EOO38_14245 [Cytophagaceae bacterium]|nr:MAG: hypothetical protein EOO38_14245 [Cytophagaceae bacterium]
MLALSVYLGRFYVLTHISGEDADLYFHEIGSAGPSATPARRPIGGPEMVGSNPAASGLGSRPPSRFSPFYGMLNGADKASSSGGIMINP